MDKTGELAVGVTPCERCGKMSQVEKDGYFYCSDCANNDNKKILVFSQPHLEKKAASIENTQ